MSKISDYILPLGILAGVGVAIYLAYNYLKGSPVGQVVGSVGGGLADLNKSADVIGLTPTDKVAGVLIPPLGVSNVVTKAAEKINLSPVDVGLSALFPPVAIYNVVSKAIEGPPKATTSTLTKSEVNQAINQMDATYEKYYPTPKINVNATPTTAALLTNTNKLQTPTVQIQAYNIAPKVVKVGNAFKKVM